MSYLQNIRTKSGSKRQTSFRKIAIGSWKNPTSPNIYGSLELPLKNIESYLQKHSKTPKITLTHVVTKLASMSLHKYPKLNLALIRNRLKERKDTHVFVTTLLKTKSGTDLNGVQIENPYKSSLQDVAKETFEKTTQLRQGKDKEINRVKKIMKSLPNWSLGLFIWLSDFLNYTLNLNLSSLKIPRDRFASVIVTSLQAFSVHEAFIPLFPYSRTPYIISIGEPYTKVVLENNQPVEERFVKCCFTADHRYIDGAEGALLLKFFKKAFQNPENYFT